MGEPTIAACVIARNSAATIERFVASARPHVDEICVWLGGESTDGTPAILERLAAGAGCPIIVEQGEWVDYAHARNQSFAMASRECDYVSWWDDDEVLEGGEWLKPLLAEDPVDTLTVRRIEVWRDVAQPRAHFRQRFFRTDLFRDGTARWTSPVHEHIVGIPETAKRSIASPEHIRVIHHPVTQPDRHKHRRLVEEAYAADPGVHLGIILARHLAIEDKNYAAAATLLEEIVAGEHPTEQILYFSECFELLAACRKMRGDFGAAEAAERTWRDLSDRSLRLGAAGVHPHSSALQRAALDIRFPYRADDLILQTYWSDPRTASGAAS